MSAIRAILLVLAFWALLALLSRYGDCPVFDLASCK